MNHNFIDAHRDDWPVHETCAALELPASGYYAKVSRKPCVRLLAAAKLLLAIRAIHAAHPA